MRLAGEKDRGFSADRFAEAIERIDRYQRRDFPIDDGSYDELRREFEDWWRFLTIEQPPERAFRPRRADPDPPGLDLGL